MNKFTMMPTIDWDDLNNMFNEEYGYYLKISSIFPNLNNNCYEILDSAWLEVDEKNNEDLSKLWNVIHSYDCDYDTVLVYVAF